MDNDYIGMAQDLRRMLDSFYDYRNDNFIFLLTFEETEYLNELVLFREHCLREFEYDITI